MNTKKITYSDILIWKKKKKVVEVGIVRVVLTSDKQDESL